MANKSDHKQNRTRIDQYLPEVNRSDINVTLFEGAHNRHLTKDNTTRINGYVGDRNAASITSRRIVETDPHVDAFQLEPVMLTNIGVERQTLTQQSFLEQLTLLGINTDKLPEWATTTKFNWVPPINMDMLVNYYNYFWQTSDNNDAPQYFTIESACNKAQSRVDSYSNIISQRGESFAIAAIDVVNNTFVINNDCADIFNAGFRFKTSDTTNRNFLTTVWTVVSSQAVANVTTITVLQPIAIKSATTPPPSSIGRWWYNTTTMQLSAWDGNAWVHTSSQAQVSADLTYQLEVYRRGADCACDQQVGWDVALWDDNQLGDIQWSDAVLDAISFLTEAEWISANGIPVLGSIWYNVSTDELLVRDASDAWKTTVTQFSIVVEQFTGTQAWDATVGCEAQVDNPWYTQNKWIHKSQIQSSVGIKRAAVPIIEYDSRTELNNWVQNNYAWKYRSDVNNTFVNTTSEPFRLELDPIKGFTAVRLPQSWIFYLYDVDQQQSANINYTDTFKPGYVFRTTDDTNGTNVCTTTFSIFRETNSSDPIAVRDASHVTVVYIDELDYDGATSGGTAVHSRIEPVRTSQGDSWRGYHVHWLLDVDATTQVPASPQTLRTGDGINTGVESTPIGEAYFSAYHQETITTGVVTVVDLLPSLTYNPANPSSVYAVAGGSQLRVYVNGVRQYGNYVENTATVDADYVMIGTTSYTSDDSLSPSIEYVTGVTFDQAVPTSATVRLEVGPSAVSDVKLGLVPVRTIESEVDFALAIAAKTQPVMSSLIKYERLEQQKSQLNQYPLFNVYDITTSEVVSAASLFAYEESDTNKINLATQRRITSLDDGRDFVFNQTLLDGSLTRAYRLLKSSPFIWYSPLLNTVKVWTGTAYSNTYSSSDSLGLDHISEIVASQFEPMDLNNVPQALWFDTTNSVIKARNVILEQWVTQVTPVVRTHDSDPLLQTVWKQGNNAEQYTPAYVDSLKAPIAIGDERGSWETLSQWYFNSEHDNKVNVSYAQLVSHFNDILVKQLPVPALQGGGAYSYTQQSINPGLGGLIREHNDSFDLLISAINDVETSPVSVIEFAESQYDNALLSIKQYTVDSLTEVFSTISPINSRGLYDAISSEVINKYETNDFNFRLYGDSSSYNPTGDVGIKSWISTLPMFGFADPIRPLVLTDGTRTEVLHHDGHRSTISYSSSQAFDVIQPLLTATGSDGVKLTHTSSSLPPTSYATILSTFVGSTNVIGKLWYTTTFGTRNLYQLQAVAIAGVEPIITSAMTDGTKYYNTVEQQVYEVQGNVWIPTTDPVGNLGSLWTLIDVSQIVAESLVAVETLLYNVSLSAPKKAVQVGHTALQESDYRVAYSNRFLAYVANQNIRTPFVNLGYNATDAFTWNYMFSTISTPPSSETQDVSLGSWQGLYNDWFNTPVPHLEPWKLQGYESQPDWWNAEYLNTDTQTYGNRRWKYIHATTTGMWYNILNGIIPAGKTPPVGTVPTYSYVPVNISDSDTTLVNGFAPDDLLPPYFNTSTSLAGPDVRSLFTNYSVEIISPNSDYAFGFVGPVEWAWNTSTSYKYDLLIIDFLMQPVKFLHYAFGPDYVDVGGLRYDLTSQRVYSHDAIQFHGESLDETSNVSIRGLNQWYVNQNRYAGRDTGSTFNTLWKTWTPYLGYQTNGIVDTSTFSATNKYFDITTQDYNIVLAKDGTIDDVWVDAFRIDVLSIPPAIMQYNNELGWKLSLSTLSPVNRTMDVYGVKKYPFTFAVNSTIATIFEYPVVQSDDVSDWMSIRDDQTNVFKSGDTVVVTNSTANNGTYTVRAATYDPALNLTKLYFVEQLVDLSIGTITADRVTLPWNTGDQVILTTTKKLPLPLLKDIPYYVVRVNDYSFSLAETQVDAMLGNVIDFTTAGQGIFYIGEVHSTFQVYGGASVSKEQWIHYAIDERVTHKITPPTSIAGIQALIDIVDGYEAVQRARGLVYGAGDYSEYDPNTGRLVAWQSEVERFIDWAFSIRRSSIKLSDRYEINVSNVSTDEFTFVSDVPGWISGTPIVLTTTGSLPTGTASSTQYFYIPTGPNTFKLSAYKSADPLAIIDITSIGSGTIFISMMANQQAYPSFELNPTRNQIVFNTPVGMLANVLRGAQADARISQTLFDQYARPISSTDLLVFRSDLESRIKILENVPNDVELQIAGIEDPYNYLHIGGAHLFVNKYQHIVLFNSYTLSGSYIYDPFVGLNVKRFNLDYYETSNYTLRPTIGGHYLIGSDFKRNIEGSISDIQTFYSAYDQIAQTDTARYSKQLFDYTGNLSFLDALNVNPASQFAFYRGMIQSKGSVESINAYINSRRFVDAKIDEFWAWKQADFGDKRPKYYPEIKLRADDAVLADIQLVFAAATREIDSVETLDLIENGFEVVEPNSQTRYYKQPDQNTGLFLDVDVAETVHAYVGDTAPISIFEAKKSSVVWVNPTDSTTNVYNELTQTWTPTTVDNMFVINGALRVMFAQPVDAVRVITRTPHTANVIDDYETSVLAEGPDTHSRINSHIVNVYLPSLIENASTYDVFLTFYGLVPSAAKNNTARLIDVKTQTTNSLIPMWDPARGVHYHIAIHNVDLLTTDPALYSNSLSTTDLQRPWTFNEVGTRWVDSSLLSYVPYYDEQIFPVIRDRVRNWGKMADWAYVSASEWVESPVHPDRWTELVQAGQPLASGITPSGDVKPTSFTKTRTIYNDAQVVGLTNSTVSVNTSVGVGAARPTGLSALTTYTASISVDGQVYVVSALGSQLTTYGAVADFIQMSIGIDVLYTDVTTTAIQLIAASAGPVELIVTGGTLFTSISGVSSITVSTGAFTNLVRVTNDIFVAEDIVVLTSDLFGDDLESAAPYVVLGTNPVYSGSAIPANYLYTDLTLGSTIDGEIINIGTAYTNITYTKGFQSIEWTKDKLVTQRFLPGIVYETTQVSPTIQLDSSLGWNVGDTVELYKNGIYLANDVIGSSFEIVLPDTVLIRDIYEIVRPNHIVTTEEIAIAAEPDDGTQVVLWTESVEYSTSSRMVNGAPTLFYYFWIQNSQNRSATARNQLSIAEITSQLREIPIPYFIQQNPLDDPDFSFTQAYGFGESEYGKVFGVPDLAEQFITIPVFYRAVILRSLSSLIRDNDRYIVQFTRDLSLRYQPNTINGNMDLKPKHQEWLMIRNKQLNTIDRRLWDRATESMIGYKLTDQTIRVPALNRVLYDDLFLTDTQFGLAEGQSFVRKDLALSTLVAFLRDPSRDFYPIDVDTFLTKYDFNSPDAIRAAMDEIYNTFGTETVNNLWFELLADAFTSKAEYKELMKTSWVALHGIRILDVNGLFDD